MPDVSIENEMNRPSFWVAVAIGAFAGGLSGLFGVGGGILIVPALAILTKMDQRIAHGTSLAATGPLALAGLIGYAFAGQVDWAVAGLLLIGSLVGAWIGTSMLKGWSTTWLTYGFAILLVLTAIRMLIDTPDGTGRDMIDLAGAAGLGGIGLFTGSIAGLMGVGGGIVMVPAQILLFSIPAVLAKGTSLAVIVPTALLGTIRNRRNGNADLVTAVRVGGAGAIFSYLASQVSLELNPRVSAVLFGLLLLAAATRMLMKARKLKASTDVVRAD
jgi:uncharacterized protein